MKPLVLSRKRPDDTVEEIEAAKLWDEADALRAALAREEEHARRVAEAGAKADARRAIAEERVRVLEGALRDTDTALFSLVSPVYNGPREYERTMAFARKAHERARAALAPAQCDTCDDPFGMGRHAPDCPARLMGQGRDEPAKSSDPEQKSPKDSD